MINKPVIVQRVCCVHQSKIAMARYDLPEMSIMSKCEILIDLIFNYNASHDKEKVFDCIFKCISVRFNIRLVMNAKRYRVKSLIRKLNWRKINM